ncbi:Golgi transport complex subunit 3, partial [Perkinsus olseni]
TVGTREEVSSSLYKGFEAARAAEVRPIIDVLIDVARENDDYVATIYAVHQYYCTVRQAPVSEWVNDMLDSMAATEENDEKEGLEEEESDILPYTRHVCRQVLSMARAECRTYTAYFGDDVNGTPGGSSSTSQTGLVAGADEPIEEYLGNCYGKPLYAFLRSKIVSCQKVETLKNLAELISREVLAPEGFDAYDPSKMKQSSVNGADSDDNSLLVPVLSVVYRLLKDVQERLIYRAQTYIRDDIRGFEPSQEDLKYPLRLFEDEAPSVHPESEAYGRLMKVSTTGWYPTLGKTLFILAEILPVLETTTFQSLAYEAVSACLETIDIAAVDIARSHSGNKEAVEGSGDDDADDDWVTLNETLFTIRHLLILREQIASFEVDLVSSSQYLDFTNVKHSLLDVLSFRLPGHTTPGIHNHQHQDWGTQQQTTGSSASNVPSRILSTFTPVIQSRQSDVKRDIEAQLKSACDRVETDVPVIAATMRAYLTLSEPADDAGRDSPTAGVSRDSTPTILFQPIHVRVVDVCRELERNGASQNTSVSSTDLSRELSRLFDQAMEQTPQARWAELYVTGRLRMKTNWPVGLPWLVPPVSSLPFGSNHTDLGSTVTSLAEEASLNRSASSQTCPCRGLPLKDWSYPEDEELWRWYWRTPITDTISKPWALLSVCPVGPDDDVITPAMLKRASALTRTPPPPLNRSPMSPSAGAEPVPCSSGFCDYMQRKDRLFIRGTPYTNSQTRTLVDHASINGGAKLLGAADGLSHPGAVLNADDGKYMMCQCDLRKKWLTFALDDDTYVDKIALDTKEYFSSTFRHLQVLGSRKYPTDTWRVLGEIETDPTETQQWFDLSHTSRCAKCYVKYIKIRVLTSHTMEGYGICTLTRLQLFGGTLLQNLHKLQRKYEAPKHPAASVDAMALEKTISSSLESLSLSTRSSTYRGTAAEKGYSADGPPDFGSPTVRPSKPSEAAEVGTSSALSRSTEKQNRSSDTWDAPSTPSSADAEGTASEGPPLLRFVEEMSALEANYHQLSSKVEDLVAQIRQRDEALNNAQKLINLDVGSHVGPGVFAEMGFNAKLIPWVSSWIESNGFLLGDVYLVVVCTLVASTAYLIYRVNGSSTQDDRFTTSSDRLDTDSRVRLEELDREGHRWRMLGSDLLGVLETAALSKLNKTSIQAEASGLSPHLLRSRHLRLNVYEGFLEAAVTEARTKGLISSSEVTSLWLDDGGGPTVSGAREQTLSRVKRMYCFMREKPVHQLIQSVINNILASFVASRDDQLEVIVSEVCDTIVNLAHRECRTYRSLFTVDTGSRTCVRFNDDDQPFLDMIALREHIASCTSISVLSIMSGTLSSSIHEESLQLRVNTDSLHEDGRAGPGSGESNSDADPSGLSSEPLMRPVAAALIELLEIAQAAIDFTIQHYISDNILDFTPSPEDLEYPQRLLDIPTVKDDERQAIGTVMQTSLQGWYPTVSRTAAFLITITPLVERSAYHYLAKGALEACVRSLTDAAAMMLESPIRASSQQETPEWLENLHQTLFLIRQLLILRDCALRLGLDSGAMDLDVRTPREGGAAAMKRSASDVTLPQNPPSPASHLRLIKSGKVTLPQLQRHPEGIIGQQLLAASNALVVRVSDMVISLLQYAEAVPESGVDEGVDIQDGSNYGFISESACSFLLGDVPVADEDRPVPAGDVKARDCFARAVVAIRFYLEIGMPGNLISPYAAHRATTD